MTMAEASSMAVIVAAVLVAVLISTSEGSYYPPPPPSDELWRAGAITCGAVIQEITPCRGYIVKAEPEPTKACCNGVNDIYNKAKTRPDRIDACKCIKNALPAVGPYDPNRIPLIPTECGLPFSLPAISKHTDCNKVVRLGF